MQASLLEVVDLWAQSRSGAALAVVQLDETNSLRLSPTVPDGETAAAVGALRDALPHVAVLPAAALSSTAAARAALTQQLHL